MAFFLPLAYGYLLGSIVERDRHRTISRRPREPVQTEFPFPRSYKPGKKWSSWQVALAVIGAFILAAVAVPIAPLLLPVLVTAGTYAIWKGYENGR